MATYHSHTEWVSSLALDSCRARLSNFSMVSAFSIEILDLFMDTDRLWKWCCAWCRKCTRKMSKHQWHRDRVMPSPSCLTHAQLLQPCAQSSQMLCSRIHTIFLYCNKEIAGMTVLLTQFKKPPSGVQNLRPETGNPVYEESNQYTNKRFSTYSLMCYKWL